jgi:two-component system chemotaxis sensor kinase CheA
MTKNLDVLYVEDNISLREKTSMIFESLFKSVEVASDGLEGLDKYNNNSYDIVFTDIRMPNLDGVDMSKAILETNPKQHIIAITAHNETELLEKLINIGIDSFIKKPIDTNQFVDEIYKVSDFIEKDKKELERINQINILNHELDAMINSFDRYVIASRTDLKGIITYASKAYQEISKYSEDELLGKPHNIVRHPDMPKEAFKQMWDTIKSENIWKGEVKNLRKDGTHYWVNATIGPYYDREGNHIGYSAVRLDITPQKEVEALNEKIDDLLNNAGEGFLSFDQELNIEDGYSKECLKIFKLDNISGQDISDLLFNTDKQKKKLFVKGITNILNCNDNLSNEMYLSLLPSETTIYNRFINIEYKELKNDRFMVILSDVTQTKQLEQKLEDQSQIQKMIVSIASGQSEFLELKSEFESFLTEPPEDIESLQRELHTFKGIFAQKEILYLPQAIHNVESKIRVAIEQNRAPKYILSIVQKSNILECFEQVIDIIDKILGKDFMQDGVKLKVDVELFSTLESKVGKLIQEMPSHIKNHNNFNSILEDFEKLKYIHFEEMLRSYPLFVKRIAQKLDKYIYPMNIVGEDDILVSSKLKSFTKSLVHLFNNCIDHGIEDIETRVANGKDEMGSIYCRFEKISDLLHLHISDDGAGIDIESLCQKAIDRGIKTRFEIDKMDAKEKTELIFCSGISSKDEIGNISGRGVGMNAIWECLQEINGKVDIKNNPGQGVEFDFFIPLEQRKIQGTKESESVLSSIALQTKLFLNEWLDIKQYKKISLDKFSAYKHNATIAFSGKCKGKLIMSFDDNILNNIANSMIDDSFLPDEKAEMMKDIPNEVANTVIGLALNSINKQLGKVNISPPLTYDNKKVIDILLDTDRLHGILIETGIGNIKIVLRSGA